MCGLHSPDNAVRCDCGWDFEKKQLGKSYLEKSMYVDFIVAPLSDRFIARLIDSGVVILFFLVFISLAESINKYIFAVILSLPYFYMFFMDSFGGFSVGKKVMKISVINKQNEACTIFQSFIRNGILIVLGIFDLIFFVNKKKRRLGDLLAGTIVVKNAYFYQDSVKYDDCI